MPKLTIVRAHPTDAVRFNVHVFDPTTEKGGQTVALFDTGNDRTIIGKALAESIGITSTDRVLPVHGVTGGSLAQTAFVTIGIEFDEGHIVTIQNHEVAILDGTSEQVLIGRDFLEWFHVTISRDGSFTLES